MPAATFEHGIHKAAYNWGDARRALRLFRRADETANDRGLEQVTVDCLDANLEETEREATIEKLLSLPAKHFAVLGGVTTWERPRTGEIIQPVQTGRIHDQLQQPSTAERFRLGERTIQQLVGELATMELVDTWMESEGRGGRVMAVETTFDPEWVYEAQAVVSGTLVSTDEE